jgi:hypothetical protein
MTTIKKKNENTKNQKKKAIIIHKLTVIKIPDTT